MALLDDFKTRFANDPNLDLVAIENNWQAYDPVWKCYYGAQYGADDCQDEAIYQLIAHMSLTEEGVGTAPKKGIQSKSWGSESVTYGNVSEDSSFYSYFNSSKYGQRFLRIIAPNQGGIFV